MGTTASLVLQFRESGLSELRRGLSDLRRESQAAADDARGLTGTLVGASRERIRAMQAEIDAEKRLIEQKKQAQSIINQYNAEMNQRGRNRSSYEDFWTKSLAERERAEKATEDKLLREWLAAKDRRAAEVAAADRVQSDARLRRLREESDAVVRAERETVASAKRAASERAAAERAAERETVRVNNASVAERRRAEREAAAQKRREDSDYTAWWKRQIAERERAEKEGLQRIAAADRAIRERMRQSASVTTQGGASSLDFLDRTALWATGLNQVISLVGQLTSAAGSFVKEAAKWESMDMSLNLMEGSAKGAAKATADLYQIAKAPAIDLKTAQQAYIQLRAMHIAGEDSKRIIVDISNTIGRAGGGSAQFERTMLQLKDMLATGTVYQKDLRLMKEAMPELGTLMEKAFGTTTADGIRKMKVNSVEFLRGILTEMEKLPKPMQTLTSSMENFETALSKAKAAFVDTDFAKKSIDSFTSMLESMTSVLNAKSVSWGKLIWGVISGQGVSHGAYSSGKDKDVAEVNSYFDKYEAQARISGFYTDTASYNSAMSKYNKNPNSMPSKPQLKEIRDSSGKNRSDWMSFVDKKWESESVIPPAPNSKSLDQLAAEAAKRQAAEAAKKASDEAAKQAKRDQEALQKQLDANRAKLNAEAAYQTTFNDLKNKGVSESVAILFAEEEKSISAVDSRYAEMEKVANASQLNEIERQRSAERVAILNETAAKVRKIYAKEDSDKAIADAKRFANSQERFALEQKAIQEANDKLEALDEAELNRRDALYDSVAESYMSEIDLINKHADDKLKILKESGRKSSELENKINEERLVKSVEYYERAIRAALDGAETLTGSVADVYKTGIDRDYDRKKKAVEKTLSIDGLEGAARLAGKQKLDSALERLEAEHEAKMQGTYKTLFTIQKSFAIASATVQLASAAIKAMGMSGSVWEQLANAGAVMAAGGALVSTISSATYSGMYDKGGYIPRGSYGIAGENGPEIITGPARVTSTRDTARIMSGNSQPVVNVYNNAGVDVETRTNSKGELEVMINKVVEAAESRIASGIGSGSGGVDRALRSTYGLNRGR